MTLRVRPTPTRFSVNLLYTPVESILLHSLKSVQCPRRCCAVMRIIERTLNSSQSVQTIIPSAPVAASIGELHQTTLSMFAKRQKIISWVSLRPWMHLCMSPDGHHPRYVVDELTWFLSKGFSDGIHQRLPLRQRVVHSNVRLFQQQTRADHYSRTVSETPPKKHRNGQIRTTSSLISHTVRLVACQSTRSLPIAIHTLKQLPSTRCQRKRVK